MSSVDTMVLLVLLMHFAVSSASFLMTQGVEFGNEIYPTAKKTRAKWKTNEFSVEISTLKLNWAGRFILFKMMKTFIGKSIQIRIISF